MEIIKFLKEYWVLITFFIGELGALFVFAKYVLEATKCSLRNDILSIYDRCKDKKQITRYQLQSSLNMVNKDTTIKFSKLGEKAGPIGACMLSRSKLLGLI